MIYALLSFFLFILVILLATFTDSGQRESAWHAAKAMFDSSNDKEAGVQIGSLDRVIGAMGGPSTFLGSSEDQRGEADKPSGVATKLGESIQSNGAVERHVVNVLVVGSSPTRGTNFSPDANLRPHLNSEQPNSSAGLKDLEAK